MTSLTLYLAGRITRVVSTTTGSTLRASVTAICASGAGASLTSCIF